MKSAVGLLGLLFAFSAQSQILSQTEIKPPFINFGCATVGTDVVGQMGLTIQQLNIIDAEDQITVVAKSSLAVCTITTDGTRKLSWNNVNPYKGFEIQYFDDVTASIKERHAYIDAEKTYNQMGLISLNEENDASSTVRMTENADDSFSGTVAIKKSDILNAKDQQNLNAGQTVRKVIALFHFSNFTEILDGEDLKMGNESRDGRNLILYFKKQGAQNIMTDATL